MRRAAVRDLSLLYASTFIVLAGASVSPSLPLIAQEFAATPRASFWVQWIMTLPALVGLLSAPLVGWALDRWGRVRILSASIVLYLLAGAYPVMARTLIEVLLSRAVLGLAIAGTATGSITLLADYYEGERLHHIMGLQGTVNAFGGVIYALLGGYLGEWSWRAGFGLLLLGGLALPGVAFFAHDVEKQPGGAVQEKRPSEALTIERVGLVYATALAGMLLFYLVPVQLSFFLAERIQAGPGVVGVVHAAMNLSSAVVASTRRDRSGRCSHPSPWRRWPLPSAWAGSLFWAQARSRPLRWGLRGARGIAHCGDTHFTRPPGRPHRRHTRPTTLLAGRSIPLRDGQPTWPRALLDGAHQCRRYS